MAWRDPLESLRSLGSQHAGPGSLAGLHAARREHLAQFFTPLPVARFMWSLVAPAMARATARSNGLCAVIDSSAGSGRLLHFATPEAHIIDGADIHGPSIEALCAAAAAAGFPAAFEQACLSELRFSGYACALINPPFSIPLASPELEPLPCTTFGRFGPHTGALSHEYALEQALAGADLVVALLPRSQAGQLPPHALERLVARFVLPRAAFAAEGADVATSVCLFAREAWGAPVHEETLATVPEAGPDFGLTCHSLREQHCRRLRSVKLDPSEPVITLPVTGDNRVRVTLAGRTFRLRYRCGLVQAKVANALLREPVPTNDVHRYPRGVRYTGQGALDLHAHLVQPDPLASLDALLDEIRAAGGVPELAPGVTARVRRLMRRHRIAQVPPERWVLGAGHTLTVGERIDVTVREGFMLDPHTWGSPALRTGETVTLTRSAGGFDFAVAGQACTLAVGEAEKRFEMEVTRPGWQCRHPGRIAAFPDLAHNLERRLKAEGIDAWLSWAHQRSSVIESKLAGRGIIAWRMSLGKARGAIALNLLGGKHNLIVVEPYLVHEMIAEFEKVGLTGWKLIDSVAATDSLARVNLVTYHRLRQHGAIVAKRLRRRLHTVVVDEGDVLSNPHSQRSRAVARLAPKELYLLTGTLFSNYPRDALPLAQLVWGDATVMQPYGVRGPHLTPALRQSTAFVPRGIDAFRERFVVTEWVTNEFKDDLKRGAKREIPMIGDVDGFRAWLAPMVSRWTGFEPKVAAYLTIPVPERVCVSVPWDEAHLAHYLEVAEEFADWYRRQVEAAGERNVSLVTLLARIGAVEIAANCPEQGRFRPYHPLTSKQRAVIGRVAEHAAAGRKSVVFARYPRLLDRLHGELLRQHGIDGVRVHGGRAIAERNAELQARFRRGDAPVAFVSTGCGQRGLNLPEAERALLVTGSWTDAEQSQMIARLCRAQQTKPVVVEQFLLTGSIDDYMAQMVAYKAEAERVGVDYGQGQRARHEFKHLDTILGEFCQRLAALRGLPAHQLRPALVA